MSCLNIQTQTPSRCNELSRTVAQVPSPCLFSCYHDSIATVSRFHRRIIKLNLFLRANFLEDLNRERVDFCQSRDSFSYQEMMTCLHIQPMKIFKINPNFFSFTREASKILKETTSHLLSGSAGDFLIHLLISAMMLEFNLKDSFYQFNLHNCVRLLNLNELINRFKT